MRRFAAIADIHGNADALTAVLEDIDRQGITDIVNLGDCFSGPLDAGGTAEILLERELPTVRGNHDRWLVDVPPEDMGAWESDAIGQLGLRIRERLISLPAHLVLWGDVFLCHATPASDTSYWLDTPRPDGSMARAPYDRIAAIAEGIAQPLMLCGHTHIARAVRLADGRMIVNPGSVGCPGYRDDQPFDHHAEAGLPQASYAILEQHRAGWAVSLRAIPYDARRMIGLARSRGREDWVRVLSTGWIG